MLLFFDIDGTLWNYKNEIRPKTIEAIRTARKNGHKCFINTGRSRAFVTDKNLLAIGFDGIVSGCGTMVEYNDKTIFLRLINSEDGIRTVETVKKYHFKPILEGPKYMYMDRPDFNGDMFGEKVMEDMGDMLLSIQDHWGKWEFQKLSCAMHMPREEKQECFDAISDLYHFIIHSDEVVEMVPNGHDKGSGIKKVCELLGEDISNTFAFGDRGVGIGMGDTYHDLNSFTDYITSPLEEDGIYNAMKHFELI